MRNKSELWKHFRTIERKTCNQKYDPKVCCLHCESYCTETGEELEFMKGRVRNLENHLRKCLHYKRRADTLERNNAYNSEDDVGTSVSQQSGTARSPSGCSSTSTCGVKRAASSTLTSNRLKTMKIDQFVDRKFTCPQSKIVLQRMVEMIADNGMPFSWVERPSTRRFFEAVRPAVIDIMPSAKALSGKLLKGCRSEEQRRKASSYA